MVLVGSPQSGLPTLGVLRSRTPTPPHDGLPTLGVCEAELQSWRGRRGRGDPAPTLGPVAGRAVANATTSLCRGDRLVALIAVVREADAPPLPSPRTQGETAADRSGDAARLPGSHLESACPSGTKWPRSGCLGLSVVVFVVEHAHVA
jgi:hypothetical protein